MASSAAALSECSRYCSYAACAFILPLQGDGARGGGADSAAGLPASHSQALHHGAGPDPVRPHEGAQGEAAVLQGTACLSMAPTACLVDVLLLIRSCLMCLPLPVQHDLLSMLCSRVNAGHASSAIHHPVPRKATPVLYSRTCLSWCPASLYSSPSHTHPLFGFCFLQEEPIFHLPFQMLSLIGEVDKLFTQWRYRHAIMVHG